MSHGSILSQQARYRSRCTGNGHQAEHQFLSATRPATPITDAVGDQAVLEAALLERIDGIFDYCAHPTGIHSIHPRPDHLTVRLDPYLGRTDRPLPLHSIAMLLPTRYVGTKEDPEGPGGVTGLRLTGVDDRGLHLGRIGTTASATLIGPTAAQWRAYLAEHRAWCADHHLEPLWESPGLSEEEARYRAASPLWHKTMAESAWLSSGLLRRIGLLHTVTFPYSVRYWYDGVDWKFALKYEHGVPVGHDALVQHLIDPAWGLPLRIARRHCECRSCDCDAGRERMCRIELAPREEGREGGLQLRFHTDEQGYDLTKEYAKLVVSGARPSWLRRSLPEQHRRAEEAAAASHSI